MTSCPPAGHKWLDAASGAYMGPAAPGGPGTPRGGGARHPSASTCRRPCPRPGRRGNCRTMTATVLDASPAADALRQVPGPLTGGAPRRPTPRGAGRRPLLPGPLGTAGAPPVAVLVAPAGYGKTALLREWSRRDARPFAWVTLDRRHDLPRCLLSSIARAVDEAVADARSTSIVLVLDDVHLLTSQGAREIIAALTRQPPEGMTIALASRTELGLPLARLRAEGLVPGLGPADLAMTRAEAAALLRAGGLRLDRDELDALVRR